MSQQSTDGAPTNNPYTTPATMLIIGLLFAGGGTALFHNPVVQLIIGLGALLLILGAAVLAVRRMQREQNR